MAFIPKDDFETFHRILWNRGAPPQSSHSNLTSRRFTVLAHPTRRNQEPLLFAFAANADKRGGQVVICVSDQALAPWADLGYLEWFMNDELLNSTPSFTPRRPLEERLAHRPAVLARLHQLADTLEQSVGDDCTADQAEERVSEQMRQLAREVLEQWAQEAASEAPVRAAHRDLEQRRAHLDYAGARAQGLNIGSGEIESGHRHVIQQRLKLAGSWWKEPHAEKMLGLRVARANHLWHRHWSTPDPTLN